jgi:hypothetical protein
MTQIGSILLALLVGVIGSLIAAEIYRRTRIYLSNRSIDIEGTWWEEIKPADGHGTSIGRIYFDKSTELWRYDGTNYREDGAQHSHWQTIISYVDYAQKRVYYIFSAHLDHDLSSAHYGFGAVNLTKRGPKLVPVDGFFTSQNVEGGSRRHGMVKLPFAYERGQAQKMIEALKEFNNRNE